MRGYTPDHQRHGYGSLWVGEKTEFYMDEAPEVLRSRIASYSRYHGKKFKTWTEGPLMYVMRVY